MKNILKFGLISAVTAIALAQTPAATQAQTMDEDVLAIATRGALSDSMQGFRKLADDEAGSIFGGLDYFGSPGWIYTNLNGYDVSAAYQLTPTASEWSGKKINIGNGDSYNDYYEFMNTSNAYGGLFFYVGVNYRTNTVTKMIIDRNFRRVNTAITNRILQFAGSYYNTRFGQDRSRFGL